jgi:hypothetical protein
MAIDHAPTHRVNGRSRIVAIAALALFVSIPIALPNAYAAGETVYALTTNGQLVSFNAENPCDILSSVRITGLEEDETLLGIDFRPATGQLYGLGSSSRLYVVDTATGVATAIGSGPFSPALDGSDFGFDFNPTVDRIRIVSDSGQDLRAHPDLGTVVSVDGTLAYAAGDANAGATPSVTGAAYLNPDTDPTTGTTLYDIDAGLDVLVTQNPPNSGTLNTIGSLGVRTNHLVGFDIGTGNVAYAALKITPTRGRTCGNSSLVSINLATGAATSLGTIGVNQPILGLAVELQ